MRRLGMTFLFSLLSISTHAGNFGFYGGVSAGYGDFSMDTKFNLDTFDKRTTVLLIDNHTFTREIVTQLRVGYANGLKFHSYVPHWYERFHWAVEAFFEPQSHTISTNNELGAAVDYHLKFNYGATLKPGIQTTLNTTVQMHIGVVRADFTKISTTPGLIGFTEVGNQGKSDTGVRVGFGFEGRLNRNMSLEISATRTYFSNKGTDRYLNPYIIDETGTIFTQEVLTFRPRTDQILLNFNYYLVR
jgi:hypothetical protein